jgi:hypothetical protein
MNYEKEHDIYIDCVGIDNKLHVCKPYESKTKCGIPIKKKKLIIKDRVGLYSCYECTY